MRNVPLKGPPLPASLSSPAIHLSHEKLFCTSLIPCVNSSAYGVTLFIVPPTVAYSLCNGEQAHTGHVVTSTEESLSRFLSLVPFYLVTKR